MGWEQLDTINVKSFNETEAMIHRASQFLAMLGKHYVANEQDDSNANLVWSESSGRIEGRKIQGEDPFYGALQIDDFSLSLIDDSGSSATVELNSRTKDQIFYWLKFQLLERGMDTGDFDYISHYEVPEHPVDLAAAFVQPEKDIASEWKAQRSNANTVLSRMNEMVGQESEVRIWPHHFDTGVYYPFGESMAIGAGWAIGDSLSPSPYFYIYGWSREGSIDYQTVPELQGGHWHVDDSWQGAIFSHEELLASGSQESTTQQFARTAIDFFKNQFQL